MNATSRKDRTALITGANRGIGLAVARALGDRGFQIWMGTRDPTNAQGTVEELQSAGIDAHALQLNVTDADSIRAAVHTMEDEVEALDLLVNNAGINFGPPGDPSTESLDDVTAMFDTNTFGPLRVTQTFLPLLRKATGGRIVMVTSGLGSMGSTLDPSHENWGVAFAGYSASKSALNMLSIKLAKELLSEGTRVNLVDPGLTATPLGGPFATRSVEEGAAAVVAVAIGDHAGGPTPGFYRYDSDENLAQHRW